MTPKHLRPLAFAWLLIATAAGAARLDRGLGPEPDSLDIHQAQGLPAIHVLREIREGLVTFDAAGEVAGGVALRWSVDDEGLLWHFELRPNARWSNGDPVVAADFVRAWRRALAPASLSRNAPLLDAIENAPAVIAGALPPEALGVRALAADRLELRLSRPVPWLPEVLAHPVSYPLHANGIDEPLSAPVNGAFTLAEVTPHARLLLRRNEQFHSAAEVRLDEVALYPIEEPAAELSRYRSGELHITETIPPGRFDWLREHHPDELRVVPYLGSFWLGLNLAQPPFRGNPELRQALSLALDRETLVRVVTGAGERPAWGIVPPGLGGLEAPGPPGSLHSQAEREAEARRLFRLAGYGPERPLRLELRYNTSSQHRRMAIAVAAMWKQVLGVATGLINEEWKVFVNNRGQGVLTQVFRGGWIADYADPASFLDLFLTDSDLNWSAYANPAYDELVMQAAGQAGDARAALLQQAHALLLRDTPVIPLYYYVSRHLVKPGVDGFIDNIRDIHLSRYLDIDTQNE
ncbi:MAG: peptide ABC transporter substrate-binding protein [Xanthomonadales bacterium]|nr:peptide ABC transporter substrate-binding protein [Xanthomonadales bacterium]